METRMPVSRIWAFSRGVARSDVSPRSTQEIAVAVSPIVM